MSRCKLTELTKTYDNKEEVPYTAEELAIYMQDYLLKSEKIPIKKPQSKDIG